MFTDYPVLLAALQRALARADFDAAGAVLRSLREQYGESAMPAECGFLEELGQGFWRLELEAMLAAWDRAALRAEPPAPHFEIARRAFLSRVVDRYAPERVLLLRPGWIGAIHEALRASGRLEEGRRLLREALLSGAPIDAEPIEDEPVAELLSENLAPRWLASLGAIRRLWPLPRPDARAVSEIAASLSGPVPRGDAERALAFWNALRLAELRSAIPEELLHRARVRLKRLHPELHAEYMGLRPRDAGFT